MPDALSILRRELDAEVGSFLLRLRCDLIWDRAAFSRLTQAMLAVCRQTEAEPRLERELAEGYWYVSWFVRQWSSHPDFPREMAPDYYEKAYERLDDLASWFFSGQSPYREGRGFEPL